MKEKLQFCCQILSLMFLAGFITGCRHEEEPAPVAPCGKVIFSLDHQVNGGPLVENELIYTNAAGNEFMVTELKYFISDITFYGDDGSKKVIGEPKAVFYVDENMEETKTIRFQDNIPAGSYDSINFTFGIDEQKNRSNMFVNPPEVNMFWPEVLGGGYHYMMFNGNWKDTAGIIQPFNFHLGIGQLYHGNTTQVDSIYAFVQNYFTVSLPGSGFTMHDQQTLTLQLSMNIENWFVNPHVFDFNLWGGAIMQNQSAMQVVRENGWNVFSVKIPAEKQ